MNAAHVVLWMTVLTLDSAFFATIALFKNRPFPWVSGGFLERRIPGKNGEGSTRTVFALRLAV